MTCYAFDSVHMPVQVLQETGSQQHQHWQLPRCHLPFTQEPCTGHTMRPLSPCAERRRSPQPLPSSPVAVAVTGTATATMQHMPPSHGMGLATVSMSRCCRMLATGTSSAKPAGHSNRLPEETVLVDALLRYAYYQCPGLGLDVRHITPYHEAWLAAALTMVPSRPPPFVSMVCAHMCMCGHVCAIDVNCKCLIDYTIAAGAKT